MMSLEDAIKLISSAFLTTKSPEAWADLGAGAGLFSRALVTVLPKGSIVHAVDKEQQDVQQYSESIIFQKADIFFDELTLPTLDGILMANSLHYISDQDKLIKKLGRYFRNGGGKYILIEYDTERANRWVPFPVSFSRAKTLFTAAGLTRIDKLAERPSRYQSAGMYAALMTI